MNSNAWFTNSLEAHIEALRGGERSAKRSAGRFGEKRPQYRDWCIRLAELSAQAAALYERVLAHELEALK